MDIRLYWTVKIVDSQIYEVWVYTIPLKKSQLKPYTFEEQFDMVPLFGGDKFEYRSEYVIGYYTTIEWLLASLHNINDIFMQQIADNGMPYPQYTNKIHDFNNLRILKGKSPFGIPLFFE